jgi:hypothetical protein
VSSDASRFDPLRPPTTRRKVWLLIGGPLVWVLALDVIALVIHRTDLIALGLVIAGAAGALGALLLVPARRARIRREDAGAPGG